MANKQASDGETGPPIQWNDFARFVRQLSHDLRNHLNAIELQSALLNELVDDAEAKEEILRLREMTSSISGSLQKVVTNVSLANPQIMAYKASDLVEDLQASLTSAFPEETKTVHWHSDLVDEQLEVDPQLIPQAFCELFRNALKHDRGDGKIAVTATASKGRLVITLTEPKTAFDRPTDSWATAPLRDIKRGNYGLGLQRVRAILESHQGDLRAHFDREKSALITTATLPLLDRS